MKYMAHILLVSIWVAGWVLAKGFWSTFLAVIFPLWSLYLLIENFLI